MAWDKLARRRITRGWLEGQLQRWGERAERNTPRFVDEFVALKKLAELSSSFLLHTTSLVSDLTAHVVLVASVCESIHVLSSVQLSPTPRPLTDLFTMVHLAQIKNDSEIISSANKAKRGSIVPGLEHISLEAPSADDFSTSVYGSRFASEDLPSVELPDKEMPKEIAYRMIKDELSLDGNPMLKFVYYFPTASSR